jgi:polyisoprenyl-teichoic acid--peptidoglycan teichoic acid transferase
MSKRDNKRKMSKNKKVVLWTLGVVLFLLLGLIGGGYWYANNMLNKVEKVEINTNSEELGIKPEVEEKSKEIRNIALFGIDAPEGDVGRSDSIMILTLDSVHNKLKLTSVMRDSYVNIPGRGLDKINHAYAFGGPELAIRTLNENFDLNIKEFMAVDFTSLPTIIDKLGGVNINIIPEEISHIPGVTSAGNQVLNGKQALAYSRIRYASGGDYKRTERQRTVVDAIFNKVKDTTLTEYPALISEFLPFVKTNMSPNEILTLGKDFSGLISSGLAQERFPRDNQGEGQMIDGVYYLTFDRDLVRSSVHNYIFEDK